MDKRLNIKATSENSNRIIKLQKSFQKEGDVNMSASQNDIANTAMLIGLLELGRRHKVRFS